jgi:tetratricopeptide (TPR) repeat protein
VHWRLRTALSSQQLFIELFMELSQAAASCYSRCGHLRSAALLLADVADALAKQGSLQKAAELYEQQCRCYLREGWLVLAAAALPKLAACQLACGSLGLAHTAAALLSLPEAFRGTPAERHAACQLLRQAAAATEGMAGCRPLLPTSPLLAGAALPEAAVSLSAAIVAAPLKASISRFFGRSSSGSDGGAVLAPPPGAAGSGAALAAAVGDVVAVQLLVDNQLPEALLLRGVTLTLTVLQEMTGEGMAAGDCVLLACGFAACCTQLRACGLCRSVSSQS